MIAVHTAPQLTTRRPNSTAADRVRRRLAVGAVLATPPYSALKIAWLSGSRIGLRDPSFGTSATMHVLNTATLALDLVALSLAVVFFTGARAPKWFLLPTMWVGYGLLGQIVMLIGPSVVVQLIAGRPSAAAGSDPIATWVYAAVYTGFSGLGLCLLPAFGIYAWQHWAKANGWAARLDGARRGLPIAPTMTVAMVTVALLVRAVGSDSASDAMGWAVDSLIGLLVVLTVRMTSQGRPRRMRRAVPLTVLWTASGAWTAWAAYGLVLGIVPNDLVDHTTSAWELALHVAKIVAGTSLLLTVRRVASAAGEVSRP
jgi:hypothetical protein